MNWWRFFILAGFFIEQNSYFGWNTFPKSDFELIADGITILLGSMCFESDKK